MNMLQQLMSRNSELDIRVQYALLTVLAILCSEFSPVIQNTHHHLILQLIVSQMNSANKKIELRAISSLINFIRDLCDNSECTVKFEQYNQLVL